MKCLKSMISDKTKMSEEREILFLKKNMITSRENQEYITFA